MPTLFEGILAGQRANLQEQQLRLGAIQESQSLLGLRDRVAETFAFENLVNSGLDPISAISAAQSQVPLGAFRSLAGTDLAIRGGQLGLQNQQIQNQLGASLFQRLGLGGVPAQQQQIGAFTNSNPLIDSLLGNNNQQRRNAFPSLTTNNTGRNLGSTDSVRNVSTGNFANDLFSP
jgi:hypothetical protein